MAKERSKLAEEMQKMAYEPLLPIEQKLIVWSLSLGIVLLVVLVLISIPAVGRSLIAVHT